MAKRKDPISVLPFPVGGIDRHMAYDMEPPLTTPYAVNVRPYDSIGTRQRGGSRPGLNRSFSQNLGGGSPVQLLNFAGLNYPSGNVVDVLLAISNGVLYSNWVDSADMATVSGGATFSTTALYIKGTQVSQLFYIADVRSNPGNLAFTGTNGTLIGTPNSQLSDTSAVTDWTTLGIDTTNDVVFVSGQNDLEANIFPIASVSTGHITLTTIGAPISDQSGGVLWQIGRIPKQYDPDVNMVTGMFGPLPVPPTNYSTGTIVSASGAVTLTGGTFPIFTATQLNNGVVLTVPNASGIGTSDYLVASQADSTHLTLTDTTIDADGTYALGWVVSWTGTYYGLPPLGCPLCCTYRGRLVLAGYPANVWYMSRVLDPTDFDFGFDPNDPSRAVGGTNTTTGGIPEEITALIPISDSYLIFGCERSLWLLTADPAYGGQITAMSRAVGVLGPNGFCSLPDGSVVFLSRDGLYEIPARLDTTQLTVLKAISRPKIPAELLDVDWRANYVNLCYDIQARGIHISVTPANGSAGTHYFYDIVNGGFWLIVYGATGVQPTTMIQYASTTELPLQTMLGGYDGYLRSYSPSATNDDGNVFSTAAVYAAWRPGGPGYVGQITMMQADLDASSGNVNYSLYKGGTPELAATAAISGGSTPWTGQWMPGSNHRTYPRFVGPAVAMLVTGAAAWAMEEVRLEAIRREELR